MDSKPTGRIASIDFLKTVGLLCIILAHVGAPDWLMMIRSFDVPLMVILSALLAGRSYAKHARAGKTVLSYYAARVKRLVLPTWIFLVLFFAIKLLADGRPESLRYYIASFCLTRYGIGYVWVILIYLYSALLIPLFVRLKLSWKGVALVCAAYFLYETAYHFRIGLSGSLAGAIVETTFYYIIPYGALTYLGCNYPAMKRKTRRLIALAALLVFVAFAARYWVRTGSFQLVKIAKYPPRLYFLSYGVVWAFGLLLLCGNRNPKLFSCPPVRFVSSHSLWIYLWHILALSLYEQLHLPRVWALKLLAVCAASLLITFIMNKALDALERRRKIGFLSLFRG